MTFEEYQGFLTTEFSKAVKEGIHADQFVDPFTRLTEPCRALHSEWGFSCVADCFAAAVPKSDRLTLNAWSEAVVSIDCWSMEVSCRAFYIAPNGVHIEVRNAGAQPLTFTETGYRFFFVPLQRFRSNYTVKDYIQDQLPKSQQMALF